MNTISSQHLSPNATALYRIKVQGVVSTGFADMFEHVSMHTSGVGLEDPVTTLTVWVVDQPALAGIMNYLFMFGLPILSVECLEIVSGCTASKPGRHIGHEK
jgi:hypothetical protein